MRWRTTRLVLTTLALTALSIAGFWGVDQEWRSAVGFAGKFSASAQTLYAILGLVALPALWRGWS